MANPHPELLEIILRECANAQPHPWYPALYAQSTNVPRDVLDVNLDRLRLNGLVKLTEWMPGHGQGYQLTPHGVEVLRQPRLLGRLRDGDVPRARQEPPPLSTARHAVAGLRGEKVRAALLDDSRPLVTHILLALNILWFFVGLWDYTARHNGPAMTYLNDMSAHRDIGLFLTREELGALSINTAYHNGEWWRLLSYGFLHAGILHIGMNMYALFSLGPLLERMWGRVSYLAIYLTACIGSGAVALVLTPNAYLIGASGAICGLLGSMATWVYLNRNYLPPHVVTTWRQNIVTNIVLIAIISFMPGVSWAGHAGGGLTGAVVAAPLCMATFEGGAKRWLGWAGVVAVMAVGLCLAHYQVAQRSDQAHAGGDGGESRPGRNGGQRKSVDIATNEANRLLIQAEEIAVDNRNVAAKLLNTAGPKEPKDPARAKAFRAAKAKLEEKTAGLAKITQFVVAEQAEAVKAGLAFYSATARYFGSLAEALEAPGPWTREQIEALKAEHEQSGELRSTFLQAWDKLRQAWPSK